MTTTRITACLCGLLACLCVLPPVTATAQTNSETSTDSTSVQTAAGDSTAAQGAKADSTRAAASSSDASSSEASSDEASSDEPSKPYDRFVWGMYGRVGVDMSFNRGGAIGRTFNLSGMGSIGGRMEEGDYFELLNTWRLMAPEDETDLAVDVHFRFVMFSKQGQLVSFPATNFSTDLAYLIGGAYVQAENLWRPGLNVWAGARYYRGPDVHIADYYYFNDLYGQGFGVQYNDTEAAILVVAPTDTTNLPPYVFNNLISGEPTSVRRQRYLFTAQHKIRLGPEAHFLHLLGQVHHLPESGQSGPDSTVFPADRGYVGGIRYHVPLPGLGDGSNNDLAVRYGTGIANGSDGSNAFTWLTYGAPDPESEQFGGAYQWQVVDNLILNLGKSFSLGGYVIYRSAKGGAESDDRAPNFEGVPVFNRKRDLGLGARGIYYLTDRLHLIGEAHYGQRKNGTNPYARLWKFTVAPTIVPTGERGYYVRPHIRLVYSVALYNDYALDELLSPYLQNQGRNAVGHYLGVKSEWWF